mmetsp:Transcript_85910/g.247960  ORF Transcript_85910/g.247960 Transcript_85910/m.247960 type:complete len:218 (-) Transcript_85910:1596-2249(-)
MAETTEVAVVGLRRTEVVLLPRLLIAKHLVRLVRSLEPGFRCGALVCRGVSDLVWVTLPRQQPKPPLDLVGLALALQAQSLVVVLPLVPLPRGVPTPVQPLVQALQFRFELPRPLEVVEALAPATRVVVEDASAEVGLGVAGVRLDGPASMPQRVAFALLNLAQCGGDVRVEHRRQVIGVARGSQCLLVALHRILPSPVLEEDIAPILRGIRLHKPR